LLQDRKPDAKILLLSVFPRDENPDGGLRQINNAINGRIKTFADGDKVQWLDVSGTFLAPDGTLPASVMPDLLHPQAAGYEMWAKAIESRIAELTGTAEIQ